MADTASIAREYLDTFNRRDWVKMRDLLHADYTYTGADGTIQHGPDAGVAVAKMFAAAMSDAKITIRQLHVSGSTAVVEFAGTGTHDGEFMGIRASNRRVTMPVCDVIDVKDGRVIAEREYMDMAHLMKQFGAAPVGAGA